LLQDFVQQKTQVQAACDLCHVLYTRPCLCASLGSTSARAPNTCCSCDQLQDNHSQQFCTAFPGYKGTQNQEQHPYTQVQSLVPHMCVEIQEWRRRGIIIVGSTIFCGRKLRRQKSSAAKSGYEGTF
jgi:hypothetical protein